MPAAVRKIGRSGAGGKVVAPHPDEAIGGVSPPGVEALKPLPGLRTRKIADTKSPEETSYASTNLAAAVLKSLQKDKQERRHSLTRKEEASYESTPKLVVEAAGSEKTLPEVPHKKGSGSNRSRSSSRGKEPGPIVNKVSREEKEACRSRGSVEEKCPSSRRSVSAQPMRESRHREPFDCSSKVTAPNFSTYRGVAKAFLKPSKTENLPARKNEAPSKTTAKQEEEHLPKAEAVTTAANNPESASSKQLQERISVLEKKVVQLTVELRDTKELLHASNPGSNKLLLDIQLRISNIEKAVTAEVFHERSDESRSSLTSLENVSLEARRQPAHKGLEERMLPHLMLLRNRPALQQKLLDSRAALQRRLTEERTLLSSKIAALETTGNVEGEVIAAEFLASLKLQDFEVELENLRPEFGSVKCSPESIEKPSPRKSSERKRKSTEPDSELSDKDMNNAASSEGFRLECDESIFQSSEDQENSAPATGVLDVQGAVESEETVCPLGNKVAMAGWYVYDGEGILLAHDDGNCSFYDAANVEEKSQYKSPEGIAPATWRDCWLVRAADPDGRAKKYVVAASAGTASDPAFCSWDFYDKTIAAYHSEALSWPLTPTMPSSSQSVGSPASSSEIPLWWYRPCGPLIASGGSSLKCVSLYDIRDGELCMKWEVKRRISSLDFCSPIQWRNRNTLLVAEQEQISVWDISNLRAEPLHSIQLPEKSIHALHIYNSDGEINGGVRQRIGSKDCGDIDGVFATQEAVHALDFRVPSGIALKIPTFGQTVHSLHAHDDAVYAGVTGPGKSMIQQWSIKMANPMLLYTLPGSASTCHESQLQISQVWGSSNSVMAINGNGLFIFEPSYSSEPRTVIGSDDLYCPSFDYANSKVLLVSKDRPAVWQYWP